MSSITFDLLVAGITFLKNNGYTVLFVTAGAQAVLTVLGLVINFIDLNLSGAMRADPSGTTGLPGGNHLPGSGRPGTRRNDHLVAEQAGSETVGKTDLLTTAPGRTRRRARLGDASSRVGRSTPRTRRPRAEEDSQPEIFADPLFRGLNPG